MPEKTISPNSDIAKKILHELWLTVTKEQNGKIDLNIDRLINSRFVSIRFCLPTQLLGKLTDEKLDCLCLQKGSGKDASLWDPRSFCNKVIIPWVSENQSVLGTSTDPYVSKPLRKKRLDPNPRNVKGKKEWILLYKVLNDVETKNSQEYTRLKMLQTLRSIHKKLAELTFEYYIPERISLEQTEKLISLFLSESSGGDRGLSIAAALFETFCKYFKLYKEIRRAVINAPDQSTGLVGDIECIDENGNIKLVVEVKERNITLIDVKSSILKTRKFFLKELLFNAPGVSQSEEKEISDLISKAWASGTNLYRLSIIELIRVGLSLTGEAGRIDFIKNVGNQLDVYNTQPSNRIRWKELLEEI